MNARFASALFLSAILAVAVYVPGLPGEFVYDDHRLIGDNDGLKRPFDPSRAFLRDYYASDLDRTGLGYYRPIAILSNELDYRWGGGGALWFHLTNLVLHVVATCCVFALARRLTSSGVVAPVVAASLFALHPAHAESVAFISGRVDPLATVFVLVTLLWHFRANASNRTWPWRVAAAGAWLCGLLSKEMAVTAPILAAVLETGTEGFPSRRDLKARAIRYVPYLVVAGVYLAARVTALGYLLAQSQEGAMLSVAKPFVALGTYLRWLVLPPFGLNLEPEPAGGSWLLFAGLGVLAAFFVLLYVWRRGFKVELATASAAGLALLPVLQLKPLETALSERFLYLPSSFAMILVGLLAARFWAGRGRVAVFASVILLGGFYAANLVPRSFLWRDEVKLWTAKDAEDGGSLKARLNLGRAHHRRGDDVAARAAYDEAIALAPGLEPQIRAEMTTLSGDLRAGDSADDLRRALAAAPEDGSLWSNLGFVLFAGNDLGGASEAFAKATELSPGRATAWLGTGLVKLRQGDFAGAEADASRAVALDPALGFARAIRGECLLRTGRACEALAAIEGLRLDDKGQREALDRVRASAEAACSKGR